jgi:hypothetical protein
MFRSQRIRRIVLCAGLEMAALMGAPLRPDELADLFRIRQQAGIEFSVRKDGKDTDGEDTDTSYGSSLRERVCARRAANYEGVL